MSVRVKICGIKDGEDALLCVDSGVDALGFIFYQGSPRYITPKQAQRIVKDLPPFVGKVGVFVNEKKEAVRDIAETVGLDAVQFHGKESVSYCNSFKKRFKVIKSFFPKQEDNLSLIEKYTIDAVLLDTPFTQKTPESSSMLTLDVVRKISGHVRFLILSGGLSVFNVEGIIKAVRPFAVDVARGVEKFPGKKDKELVQKFIKAVKRADK